jgi:hypothetical protein
MPHILYQFSSWVSRVDKIDYVARAFLSRLTYSLSDRSILVHSSHPITSGMPREQGIVSGSRLLACSPSTEPSRAQRTLEVGRPPAHTVCRGKREMDLSNANELAGGIARSTLLCTTLSEAVSTNQLHIVELLQYGSLYNTPFQS